MHWSAATHTTSNTVEVVSTQPQQPIADKVEQVIAAESTTSTPIQPAHTEVVESVAVVEKEIPVMLRGWARKQGQVVRSWKTRYFVLANGQLAYYADQREAPPFGADLKGCICLAGYRYALDDGTVVDSSKAGGSLADRKVSVGHSPSSDSFKITLFKKDRSFNDYVAKVWVWFLSTLLSRDNLTLLPHHSIRMWWV